jgi:NAD+ diphosphatase
MLQTPINFKPLISPLESGYDAALNFIFKGDELLIGAVDLAFPGDSVLTFFGLTASDFHPLGLLDQRYCRTAFVGADVQAPQGFRFSKMRPLFGSMPLDMLALAGRAFQISDWARTHRFCGACSAPMKLLTGERCYRCTVCKFMAYPRISPAMMVLVKKGDSILLARHIAAVGNRFSALAGFVEAGESVEETVHREVFEEVGLRVTNLQYFGSQPWSFPHSLMIAFTADYLSGEITVDKTEIAEAKWVGPGDEVPEYMRGVSVSGELIFANLPKNRELN